MRNSVPNQMWVTSISREEEVRHLDEEALGSARHLEVRPVHHYPHVAPALLPICCQAGQPDNHCGGIHEDKVYHSPRRGVAGRLRWGCQCPGPTPHTVR